MNTKVNARHSFKLGLNTSYNNFNQKFSINQFSSFTDIDNNYDIQIRNDSAFSEASTFQIKAFMQHKIRLTKNLDFIAGVHFINMCFIKFFGVEPRLGLTYHYKKYKLNAGVGLHSRLEPLGFYGQERTFQIWDQTTFLQKDTTIVFNKSLQATKSIHLVLGNEFIIAPKLKIKAEVYFQYLYSIPVLQNNGAYPNIYHGFYSNINFQYPSIYDYDLLNPYQLDNKGKGLNYGIDLTLEKAFHQNYYILLNGSYYQSKYKTPYTKEFFGLNWLNTKYNGGFIFSATAGKDFKIGRSKNNVFSMNMKTTWAGNNKTYSIGDIYDRKIPYSKSLKNYFKLDTRIAYIRNKKKYDWTLSLDILNTTNRVNESNNKDINTTTGILPVINYKVEF